MTHVYTRIYVRRGELDGWMAESTPDQTPGPSRVRWMEGGCTVRLHHQRQLGLLTARGICMRTLRIPSMYVVCVVCVCVYVCVLKVCTVYM